jgi:hypothetical protein|tara:strand:- start:357 stop:533 length:177 start_codon:yes stop_codon:yes gene_type:complete
MAEDKAGKKPAEKTEKSTDGKAGKKSEETTSKTVNPEGQKRVTKSYLQGWEHIWGKKR